LEKAESILQEHSDSRPTGWTRAGVLRTTTAIRASIFALENDSSVEGQRLLAKFAGRKGSVGNDAKYVLGQDIGHHIALLDSDLPRSRARAVERLIKGARSLDGEPSQYSFTPDQFYRIAQSVARWTDHVVQGRRDPETLLELGMLFQGRVLAEDTKFDFFARAVLADKASRFMLEQRFLEPLAGRLITLAQEVSSHAIARALIGVTAFEHRDIRSKQSATFGLRSIDELRTHEENHLVLRRVQEICDPRLLSTGES